ncbi:MAG: phosphate ABC transporter permease subunit PstC [Clostridia bacterium]|nr:phosphate ABC transporter permease subunit PstC [Clostridia bacterium]
MKAKAKKTTLEGAAKWTFAVCAAFSVFAVFAIVFFILYRSIPAFQKIGVFEFLFGETWAPHWEDKVLEGKTEYASIFGVSNIVQTSLIVTAGAAVLGGLIGVFTAVFTAYYCPKKLKGFFEQTVNLLSGIPSIIVGFFGVTVLVPIVEKLSPQGEGMGMLSAVLVLAIMITPTIASLSKNSLEAVPKEYLEGALGLGATKDQAVFSVLLPAAKSGIFSSLILGIGRAVGETMAVSFVIGGASGKAPDSFFKPVGSLTTTIAGELGEASFGSVHLSALTAIGFILLLFVLAINLVLTLVKRGGNREKTGWFAKLFRRKKLKETNASGKHSYRRGGAVQTALRFVSYFFAALVVFTILYLIVDIVVKGLPYISAHFLFGATKGANVTISAGLVTTLMVVGMTLLISLPLGIGGAIYLNEYAKKDSKFVKVVRLFIDTLSGVPSIVFGLFGMIFFCQICALGYSVLAGSFTMVLIVLPTIIRSTEESLKEVPQSVREGALALGASKVRTIFTVVLPSAIPGIITSIVLSVGRIVGESAALIYTSGAVVEMPTGYLSQGSTLSVFMYYFQCEGLHMNEMYATATVLIAIVLALNILIALLDRAFKKKTNGKDKKKV